MMPYEQSKPIHKWFYTCKRHGKVPKTKPNFIYLLV